MTITSINCSRKEFAKAIAHLDTGADGVLHLHASIWTVTKDDGTSKDYHITLFNGIAGKKGQDVSVGQGMLRRQPSMVRKATTYIQVDDPEADFGVIKNKNGEEVQKGRDISLLIGKPYQTFYAINDEFKNLGINLKVTQNSINEIFETTVKSYLEVYFTPKAEKAEDDDDAAAGAGSGAGTGADEPVRERSGSIVSLRDHLEESPNEEKAPEADPKTKQKNPNPSKVKRVYTHLSSKVSKACVISTLVALATVGVSAGLGLAAKRFSPF